MEDYQQIAKLRKMADRVRRTAVEMAHDAGNHGSHLGGSLSCIEIYTVIFGAVLDIDKIRSLDPERDRFVAGKEHARLAEYPVLAETGLIQKEDLNSYLEDGGLLAGHPLHPEIGLDYSCCSLGMALPVSVGMALDAKRSGRRNMVYTIMGDGEMDEGLIWEAIMSASMFKLGNLIAVVDRNGLSSDGNTEDIMALGDLEMKFRAFGWDCISVDGHDVGQLLGAFLVHRSEDKPYAIIANTVKGKGLSFVENVPGWHQNILTDELYEQALRELQVDEVEN